MPKPLHSLALIVVVAGNLSAQCPAILNCPPGNPVLCDLSANDAAFWNDAPYTWSQLLNTPDLYEATVDLNLKVLACGPGAVSIGYTLLLDLDNDTEYETAVPGNAPPPPGLVFANNASNPGYTGGDPVEFDKRPTPDSLKFRFATEFKTIGDTVIACLRWQTGNLYLLPRLPEGRHRITWRVEQAGMVKYCDHTFRVKDCLEPAISCKPDITLSIGADDEAVLTFQNALEYVADNSTPYNLLQISMRNAGNGQGFPPGNPVTELEYGCDDLGSQTIEVWVKDKLGNTNTCTTQIQVDDPEGHCLEPPDICARLYWNDTVSIAGVAFKMVWVDTSEYLHTFDLPAGAPDCALLDTLPPAVSFSLIAEKDTLPLNGVSTFDLVLISLHILGLTPFDAPWKAIAADVNRSGSITTFDIVELRKLILGIYDRFPANSSWRFFADGCDFPPNPFPAYCPTEHSFISMPVWNYPSPIGFRGIKTGDVNGTVFPDWFSPPIAETRGVAATLAASDRLVEAGEIIDLPLFLTDGGAWLGLQASLLFDPAVLEIIDVVPMPGMAGFDGHAFAQPAPGALNISWVTDVPQTVSPGEALMTLKMRVLRGCTLSRELSFAGRLPPEIYAADLAVHPLALSFSTPGAAPAFTPYPNPTTGGISIPLPPTTSGAVFVEIRDTGGRLLYESEPPADATLQGPAGTFPTSGVYSWRIRAGSSVRFGKIIRL